MKAQYAVMEKNNVLTYVSINDTELYTADGHRRPLMGYRYATNEIAEETINNVAKNIKAAGWFWFGIEQDNWYEELFGGKLD